MKPAPPPGSFPFSKLEASFSVASFLTNVSAISCRRRHSQLFLHGHNFIPELPVRKTKNRQETKKGSFAQYLLAWLLDDDEKIVYKNNKKNKEGVEGPSVNKYTLFPKAEKDRRLFYEATYWPRRSWGWYMARKTIKPAFSRPWKKEY